MALRQDAQRNRDRILAAARALLARDGLDVPVEEITRAAGVGMGTLYRHFPTKEALVDAILEEAVENYLGFAEEGVAATEPWVGLTGFLERTLELHVENRCLMDVFASEHARARVEEARARVRPLLGQLVERAQADGSLRPDVTEDDVPPLLWAAGRVIEMTEDDRPGYWRRHLALVLDGLRAGAPRTIVA